MLLTSTITPSILNLMGTQRGPTQQNSAQFFIAQNNTRQYSVPVLQSYFILSYSRLFGIALLFVYQKSIHISRLSIYPALIHFVYLLKSGVLKYSILSLIQTLIRQQSAFCNTIAISQSLTNSSNTYWIYQ